MRLVLQEFIAGLLEEALKGAELEFQQRALIDIAGTVDTHISVRPGQVGGLVILHPVGLDYQVSAAQHGMALDHAFVVRAPADAVALDKRRQRAACLWRDFFLQ